MDIAFRFQAGSSTADLAIHDADLVSEFDIETAVILSLFTDRRADKDDEPENRDRRGWWGDTFAPVMHDRIGSRLWLLRRTKELPETLMLAKMYAEEALQWLIEDHIVTSIDVEASVIGRGVLGLQIRIAKQQYFNTFYYQYVWNN